MTAAAEKITLTPVESAAYNAVLDMDIYCMMICNDAKNAQAQFRRAYESPCGEVRKVALEQARERCKKIAATLRTIKASLHLDAELSPLLLLDVQAPALLKKQAI